MTTSPAWDEWTETSCNLFRTYAVRLHRPIGISFCRPTSRMRVPEHYLNRLWRPRLSNKFGERSISAVTRVVRGVVIVCERVGQSCRLFGRPLLTGGNGVTI